MTRLTSTKTALLAAASLIAAGVAASPALLAAPHEPAPAGYAASADPGDAGAKSAGVAVKRWIAGGAIAAALAGLIRLFGWTRIAAALRTAGDVALAAPGAAIRYVGKAVRSPVRFLLVIGGLSLFALVGAGFYDIEWIAGLATGAALTLAAVVGIRQVTRLFARR
jgi:hypothetical protein